MLPNHPSYEPETRVVVEYYDQCFGSAWDMSLVKPTMFMLSMLSISLMVAIYARKPLASLSITPT